VAFHHRDLWHFAGEICGGFYHEEMLEDKGKATSRWPAHDTKPYSVAGAL